MPSSSKVSGGAVPAVSVAAVVVTRNRLDDIKRCIAALKGQTRPPDTIIVVDNGSTDGTAEWLAGEDDLRTISQANLGGAGGFGTGLRRAMDDGHDWMWCLDDDALPAPDCLEALLGAPAASEARAVLGSVVVARDDPDRLAFPIPKLETYSRVLDQWRATTDDVEYVRAHAGSMGYPWGMFYNSVLLPRRAVEAAGLPKLELFLWGDEVEYFYRMRAVGFETYLVPESVATHPRSASGDIPRWKEKLRVRNAVYIHRRYRRRFALRVASRLVRIVVSRKPYLLAPLWHGLTGDFSRSYLDRPEPPTR